MIGSNGEVETRIRQVTYMGEFSHWEGELTVKDEVVCECTAPTFWGVHDIMTEYLSEQLWDETPAIDVAWLKKDSNNK